MTDLLDLDASIRACSKCDAVLSRWPEDPPRNLAAVHPRPILSAPLPAPIMLVGQAPGLTEYRTGRAFSGGAGQGIREMLARCGLPEAAFDRLVYQTSAVKCFPGRRQNKDRWEDRPPCSTMSNNCRPFLAAQIKTISPALIISLGSFAARELDRLRGIGDRTRTLAQLVGTIEEWGPIRLIFLPHTSGASRFLNDVKNRIGYALAKEKLSSEIRKLYSERKMI